VTGVGANHPSAPSLPAKGRLFVVATPIGNLGDITLRALETLRAVRVVAAEDTRHTGLLLRHFQIQARLISYHEHNRAARLPALLRALSEGDVALVSDAGTPLISDPGQDLVAAAAAAGYEVVPIPGPAAPIAALSVSGLATSTFHFLGFLPRRAGERRRAIAGMAGWPGTIVLFEAPHRLRATLRDLLDVLGDRPIAVCCELTKLYEQVLRSTLVGAVAHYADEVPRGEFTLVVAGAPTGHGGAVPAGTAPQVEAAADLQARFAALVTAMGDRKRALAALAERTGRPRKDLYRQLMTGPQAAQAGREEGRG
jgi:16S rRNA (cytidine1402-2'-O)-methyltransferase